MFNDKFISLIENIKDLGISCEHLGRQYASKISTLEALVTQQAVQIKELQRQRSRKLQDGIFIESREPAAHPYTHPIRDIPDYSKVKK